jgi:hypothetical protein
MIDQSFDDNLSYKSDGSFGGRFVDCYKWPAYLVNLTL